MLMQDEHSIPSLDLTSGFLDFLTCPITGALFEDPILIKICGHSFDLKPFFHWCNSSGDYSCPTCRTPFKSKKDIIPNLDLQTIVQSFREQNPNIEEPLKLAMTKSLFKIFKDGKQVIKTPVFTICCGKIVEQTLHAQGTSDCSACQKQNSVVSDIKHFALNDILQYLKKCPSFMLYTSSRAQVDFLCNAYQEEGAEIFKRHLSQIQKQFPIHPSLYRLLFPKIVKKLFEQNEYDILKMFASEDRRICTQTLYNGMSLLHVAVTFQAFEFIEFLLKKNRVYIDQYSENVRGFAGKTALAIAVTLNDQRIIKLLLDYHANINAISCEGLTPLLYAVKSGRQSTVKLLLKSNILDVNFRYHSGTALMEAVLRKSENRVTTLLNDKRTHVNVVDNNNETPLMKACQLKLSNIVQLLLRQPKIDLLVKNKKGLTAMDVAGQRNVKIYTYFTTPEVIFIKIKNYLDRNNVKDALAEVKELYKATEPQQFKKYLHVIQQTYPSIAAQLNECFIPTILDEIIARNDFELLKDATWLGSTLLDNMVEERISKRHYQHLSILLSYLRELVDEKILNKLVDIKSSLHREFVTYLKNLTASHPFYLGILEKTLKQENVLGKVFFKVPFFSFWDNTQDIKRNLFNLRQCYFSMSERDFPAFKRNE